MRPVHIVIFVLAGALGGAALMMVVDSPRHTARQATVETAAAPVQPVSSPEIAKPAAPPQVSPPVAEPETPSAPQAAQASRISEPVVKPVSTARVTHRTEPIRKAAAPPRRESRPSPFEQHRAAAPQVAETLPPAQAAPAPAATTAPAADPALNPEPQAQPPVSTTVPENIPPARNDAENVTPPPAPRVPNTVTLNAGFLIPVRLLDGLSSERNSPGDVFTATLDHELVADGFVIAERGARVEGRVVAANPGKARDAAALAIELTRIHTSDGQDVPVATDSFEKHAEPDRNQDAAKVAGGAAIGAIIGAIAGGGKGAAIGAGVGAGAGVGDVVLTHRPAKLPSETRVTFRLRTPVVLTERLSG